MFSTRLLLLPRSIGRLVAGLPLLVLTLAGCKKDDSELQMDATIELRQQVLGHWYYPDSSLVADNRPFVGTIIGISRQSQDNDHPAPELRVPERLDPTWASGQWSPRVTLSDVLTTKVKKGEKLYLTVATPTFTRDNAGGNWFEGSLQVEARLVINNGSAQYDLASCTSGVRVVPGQWLTMNSSVASGLARLYTDAQGRQWAIAENALVVP